MADTSIGLFVETGSARGEVTDLALRDQLLFFGPPDPNVLCGKSGAVPIINPSPIGQLFLALKDFLNAFR